MKHLTIVVPDGQTNLSSIIGPFKVFKKANEYWQSLGKEPVFKVMLAGVSAKIDMYDGLFTVTPHCHITKIDHTDLVIIPAANYERSVELESNRILIDWITKQYKSGAEIASLCTGAFLIASTGVLDGKSCSTHWLAANEFRRKFPNVKLVADKLITDENGIYTNGGAFSFLNLLLYLVEKYYDRRTAVFCSKIFQIDIDRNSQSPFTIFTGQKFHNDEMVKEAQELLEKNTSSKISVEELSSRFSVSRRNFDRRFIKATGNTPLEYHQRVKIEVAKKTLESSRKSVGEVMFEVGYSDVKAFREVFQKITGLSPLEYKSRYNRDAV
jgi:transcriptional regulator GlxA family with amidase domain